MAAKRDQQHAGDNEELGALIERIRAARGAGTGVELARLLGPALDAAAVAPPSADVDDVAALTVEVAEALVTAGQAAPAARLLDRLDVLATVPHLQARLLRAECLLRAGRVGDARSHFAEALEVAERARDDVAAARAAIGLGGLWVNEHRGSTEARWVEGCWRRALGRLHDDPAHAVLRARLEARLAAEDSYLRRASPDEVTVAVDRLRELGDLSALAEGLSLEHHVLLGPRWAGRRRAIAGEMLDVAVRAGDHALTLQALCWQAVDAVMEGAPEADRALAALVERLDVVEHAAIRYIADLIGVLHLTRAGRLDDAEAAAAACLEVGLEVGDTDALGYYGAQLLAIRWRQGRDVELLPVIDELVRSTTVADGNHAFVAAQAALTANAGDRDASRRALALLPLGGLAGIPPSSVWLVTCFALGEAAVHLDDRSLAADVHAALAPFAHLPVVASIGIASFGPVERVLGRTARVLGRTREALGHLDRAVDACVSEGDHLVAEMIRTELAELRTDPRAATAEQTRLVVRPEGRGWVIELGGRRAWVRQMVGAAYLAELARRPRGVPAIELVAGAMATTRPQPVLDARAVVELRKALLDFDAELAEAEAGHDLARAERVAEHRAALVVELERSLDVRGSSRSFATPAERARVSVRKALLRVVDEVAAADAELGRRLRDDLETGHVCVLRTLSGPPRAR